MKDTNLTQNTDTTHIAEDNIEEVSANLAYMSYQLRKLTERAATGVLETSNRVAEEHRRYMYFMKVVLSVLVFITAIDICLLFI